MPRRTIEFTIDSYGIYTPWESGARELPTILEFTTDIPVRHGVEFGYILQISGGRGEKLTFQMDHPPFRNDAGELAPPFTGEMHIRNNDFRFFLGDTVWEPLDDKAGAWRLRTFHEGRVVADKTFRLFLP